MKIWFRRGKYEQMIEIKKEKIVNFNCTCMWMTMEKSRKKDIKQIKICKHLNSLINLINYEK